MDTGFRLELNRLELPKISGPCLGVPIHRIYLGSILHPAQLMEATISEYIQT